MTAKNNHHSLVHVVIGNCRIEDTQQHNSHSTNSTKADCSDKAEAPLIQNAEIHCS
jgi:hypothetical protein